MNNKNIHWRHLLLLFSSLLLNILTLVFLFLPLCLQLQFTVRSQCHPPVVLRQDRGVVIDQQVFHLGYNRIFPVVQHLGQVGASLSVGIFCWRQKCLFIGACNKFLFDSFWIETFFIIVERPCRLWPLGSQREVSCFHFWAPHVMAMQRRTRILFIFLTWPEQKKK